MKVCFFCASSEVLDDKYYTIAKQFGHIIAQNQWTLVTGGSNLGLMKTLIDSVAEKDGKSIGIIPGFFADKGIASYSNTELVITEDMHERKKKLFEVSDAFVILPGGFGTLDELLEIITLKQLAIYNKPIVIFNQEGFYDELILMFDKIFAMKFAKPQNKNVYFVANDIDETINYLKEYKPAKIESYWVGN